MSMSRIMHSIKSFPQKRPLLFNSIMYGSFYTGAEFAQQNYTRMYKQPTPVSTPVDKMSHNTRESDKPLLARIQKMCKSVGLVDENVLNPAEEYNLAQLKRYAVYGCFLAGPLLHGWYKWLDAFYKGTSVRIVLIKLVADQFILTPPLVTMFFVSMSVMEGKSDIFGECKAKFIPTFMTSCMYWIPMQFLNFMLVPASLRVTFVSIAAFCWVNILCYFKSTPLTEYEKDDKMH